MALLEVKNLGISFGGLRAVDRFEVEIKKGQLYGLIGPNGAGKTTMFYMICGLITPTEGEVYFDNKNVTHTPLHVRAREGIGYLPQESSIFKDLSVEENLNFYATLFGTTVEENIDLIRDIYVQIEPFKKRRAGKLSGGMKQKLALLIFLLIMLV